MATKTTKFDAAEYLTTPEAIAAYLEEAFATADVGFITHALGVVAKARGISDLSRETGLTRAALYKALGEGGNPEFGTVLKVATALGFRLTAEPIPEHV